jgi:hypothetical protein
MSFSFLHFSPRPINLLITITALYWHTMEFLHQHEAAADVVHLVRAPRRFHGPSSCEILNN